MVPVPERALEGTVLSDPDTRIGRLHRTEPMKAHGESVIHPFLEVKRIAKRMCAVAGFFAPVVRGLPAAGKRTDSRGGDGGLE
ncbi:hypothetical protein GCM10027285_26460 [Oleiagrimonas citrea]|jgi:hypothetical protein